MTHTDQTARLDDVRARIAAAATASGRDPAAVRLLAVSKTFGPPALAALAACGQRDFGENYLQEALPKIAALAGEFPDLCWHFIGPLQSNKARDVAAHFDWVHSVDRLSVAQRLSRQREGRAPLQLCLQVNVSGEASKSGVDAAQLPELARAVAALPNLRLRGLMCIPAPATGPAAQRAPFALLRALLRQLRDLGLDVDTLSMGMSADLEAAVAEGATIVRVGSALFGARDAGGA